MWTLVTGGAKRLGAEICQTLVQLKMPVVIHYNQSERAALELVEKLQAVGGQVEAIQGDFSTMESTLDFTARYLERFKETQNLINNVGNFLMKPLFETSVQEWQSLFQANLHAPFILARELVPSLLASKGQIINLGVSGLETHRPQKLSPAYFLTKEALLGLTRGLAIELAPKGVRVNMISPGYLDISVYLPKMLPMGRAATSQEVGHALKFLLDPESSYITGQNIEVAGGV